MTSLERQESAIASLARSTLDRNIASDRSVAGRKIKLSTSKALEHSSHTSKKAVTSFDRHVSASASTATSSNLYCSSGFGVTATGGDAHAAGAT
jgi:hypothetical protein